MASEQTEISSHKHREAAETVVRRLQEHGHAAYFAGGCVRDAIMGHEPSDYDVATDAPPQRVRELFRPARLVGQAFGVVMVRLHGVWLEVATFRTEWGYSDHRHPDHVKFSDAQHDALRRDFTINGLFFDPVKREVIDYVGGQEDIRNRVVRAIGQPQQRLEEDFLRMLRAVRFASKLGFLIEQETASQIRHHAPLLNKISRERIGQEMKMMLEHPSRLTAARLLQELHLDGPALHEAHLSRDLNVLAALPPSAAYTTALAAWLLDRHLDPVSPPDHASLIHALRYLKVAGIVRTWRGALVLSNEERDALRTLLETAQQAAHWPELAVAKRKRLLSRGDWAAARQLLDPLVKTMTGDKPDLGAWDEQAAELLGQGVSPKPWVTGDDLVAAGFEPGPEFKEVLDRVYDAQLEGEVVSTEQGMERARKLTNK